MQPVHNPVIARVNVDGPSVRLRHWRGTRTVLLWLAACLVLPLWVAACGGSDSSAPATPIATTIGAAGGTVNGPDASQVIIPAGALTADTAIAIAKPSTTTPSFPPPNITAAGVAYEFTPHGTTFAQPVTIRVPFDPTLVPAGVTPKLYHGLSDGTYVEVPGTTVDGNFLVGNVTSFSPFGPGYPTPTSPTGNALLFSELSDQCARESLSGNVWCWGDQGDIAYGTGLTVGTDTVNPNYVTVFSEPTALPPKSLTSIVGGNGWVCGLDVVDTWCMGGPGSYVTNASGNTAAPPRQWMKIVLPTGVVLTNLVGGGYFACGIGAANSPDQTTVGQVYCWGNNLRGYLGRGNLADGNVVLPITSIYKYATMAAGANFACAARVGTGEVDCWGENAWGQLAAHSLGAFDMSSTPIPRNLTVDPRQGALMAADSNACGLKTDGTAYCWGDNFYGQWASGTAGTGNAGQNYRDPGLVPGFTFKSIWPGQTMCGIASDNLTYCWGEATDGSLGNGLDRTADGKQTTPVAVSGGFLFASMSNLQYGGKCARTPGNEVYCWGSNRFYNLGLDSATPAISNVPVHIKNTYLTRQVLP
ncbi:hypothetical protein [Rhodoferax sp.]|uniref:hypothetical protein n=1 Tax=Rhodoferax sp. TaxID=50421 RepID=UPI00284A41F9|nr:hypothetical protein [Rhodoferax sp.]MDR3371220.1 hypothetical protein [Rhodoferax sp.]